MNRLQKLRWAERLYNFNIAVSPFFMLAALLVLLLGLLGNAGVSGWLLPLAGVANLLLVVYQLTQARRINALLYKAELRRRSGLPKGAGGISVELSEQVREAQAQIHAQRPAYALALAIAACLATYGLMLLTIDRRTISLGWFDGNALYSSDSLWWGLIWLLVATTYAFIAYSTYSRLLNTIKVARRRQVRRVLQTGSYRAIGGNKD